MTAFLKFATGMDWLSERFAQIASYTVLLSAMICAGNAFIRYGIDWSSNGLLEIQWYLFAWMVMVGAPYVLKVNEHVRVDVLYGLYSGRVQAWIDLIGIVCFMLPSMAVMIYYAFPLFIKMYVSGEVSNNAGGLIRWPAMLLLPLGFSLLFIQGISEAIKRIAWLQNMIQADFHYERPLQ